MKCIKEDLKYLFNCHYPSPSLLMTTLSNIPKDLSNSFESLPHPHSISEDLPQTLFADSSPVLIVTAGYDHTIRFWDVLQGSCVATLQHNESVKLFIF